MTRATGRDTAVRLLPGEDLRVLVLGYGRVVDAVEVTTLPSPAGRRRAFRVRFEDGGIFKARLLNDAATAEAMQRLVEATDPLEFSRVVDRHGAALLEEWIAGECLAHAGWGRTDLQDAGRLMATLHERLPGPASAEPRIRTTEHLSAELRRCLDGLAASRLGTSTAKVLAAAAEASRPVRVRCGLVHCDLCPENLVRRTDGRLCSIDNALLDYGPAEYDLGRVSYRWPMNPADWEQFLRGYEEVRPADEWRAHAPFWMIHVLAQAAWRRIELKLPEPDRPLSRLAALAGTLRPGSGISSG